MQDHDEADIRVTLVLNDCDVAHKGSGRALLWRLLRRSVAGCQCGIPTVRPRGFGQRTSGQVVLPALPSHSLHACGHCRHIGQRDNP
eukprot:6855489-Alexandrium_andersonii.AAC.1